MLLESGNTKIYDPLLYLLTEKQSQTLCGMIQGSSRPAWLLIVLPPDYSKKDPHYLSLFSGVIYSLDGLRSYYLES